MPYTRADAWAFMLECHRVLRVGGRPRLVIPVLHALVHQYLQGGNTDNFLSQMQFDAYPPAGLDLRERQIENIYLEARRP